MYVRLLDAFLPVDAIMMNKSVAMIQFLALWTVVIQLLDAIMFQKTVPVHQVQMHVLFLIVMQVLVVPSLILFAMITIHVPKIFVTRYLDVIILLWTVMTITIAPMTLVRMALAFTF